MNPFGKTCAICRKGVNQQGHVVDFRVALKELGYPNGRTAHASCISKKRREKARHLARFGKLNP